MPFTREQEEIKAKALDINLGIEEEKKKIHSNFEPQHIGKIIKIQAFYRAQYKKAIIISFFKVLPLHQMTDWP